ncbi:CHAT domain-containing protein [Streptomyces canus]|uniref:CHAT domain-containing protein n=1 Tax=Streptomyces canus TaxID=58343 RepID=UPI0033AD6D7C
MAEPDARFMIDSGFDQRAQMQRLTDRRIRLSRAYEEQTRLADGRLMLSASALREAASDGPIVVINVSALRCDALIVQASEPLVVTLPKLTYAEARSTAIRYHECLLATQAATEAFFTAREAALDGGWEAHQLFLQASTELRNARREVEKVLNDTARWLWETVVQPVKARLVLRAADGVSPPRLWWCPTGPLVGLPLHTASAGPDASAESVLDWVVSSYTPTVTALLSARRSAITQPTDASNSTFLLLSLAATPGQSLLPHVEKEAESILSRLPDDRVTVLADGNATRRRVMQAFSAHRSIHLGCHAEQDLTDPSNGALILYDGRLTVMDLGRSRFEGDFAYLSACKTAAGGIALPEESVSMAAALHFAGFRRVIATLWSVQDAAAARVADLVYEQMSKSGRFTPALAATALHRALVIVRAQNPGLPSRWSPFVHVGI